MERIGGFLVGKEKSPLQYFRLFLFLLLIGALFAICTPIYMRLSTRTYTYSSVEDVPKAQVAIVPGASVLESGPSPVLRARADAAVVLYETGKVSKILVTGDNGELNHDEVTPVRKYLIAAGIPAGDIFLDHAGFDTYSSMYRARDVFDVTSAIIVTQNFHLPRALFIMRHLGIEAYGLVPDGGQGTPWDYLREIPASDKALLDVLIHRVPKYLGVAYPLTGDGRATWY